MPRNAGKATPKDLINKLAIEHEGVERVRAFISGISEPVQGFRVDATGALKTRMTEWRGQYSSGLRNLMQRHFKKVTSGEWFSSGAVLVHTPIAESVERTWGRGNRQPHPKWDNVIWEEIRKEPARPPALESAELQGASAQQLPAQQLPAQPTQAAMNLPSAQTDNQISALAHQSAHRPVQPPPSLPDIPLPGLCHVLNTIQTAGRAGGHKSSEVWQEGAYSLNSPLRIIGVISDNVASLSREAAPMVELPAHFRQGAWRKTDEIAQTFANENLRQRTAIDGAASRQGYDWGIRKVSAAHDSVKSCPASCARQEEEQQQEQGQQQENHDCKQFDSPELQSQQQPEQLEHTQSPPLPLPPPVGLPVSTSNISSQHFIMPNISPNSAKAQISSFESCTTNTSRGCNHEVAIRRTSPLVITGITDGIGSSISSRFSRGVNVGAGEGRGRNASSTGTGDIEEYRVGDEVQGRYTADGNWYAAKVAKVLGSSRYVLDWSDGDPSDSLKCASDLRRRKPVANAPNDRVVLHAQEEHISGSARAGGGGACSSPQRLNTDSSVVTSSSAPSTRTLPPIPTSPHTLTSHARVNSATRYKESKAPQVSSPVL